MRKAHEKITYATEVLNAVSFSETEIHEQIKMQHDSVTVLNPGNTTTSVSCNVSDELLIQGILLGASKQAARRLAANIVAMKESLALLEEAINKASDRLGVLALTDASDDVFDMSRELENRNAAITKLRGQITRGMVLLTGKDKATAELVKKASNDSAHALLFKCWATLSRIHSKVLQAKLAAVPYERHISQAKGSMCQTFIYGWPHVV